MYTIVCILHLSHLQWLCKYASKRTRNLKDRTKLFAYKRIFVFSFFSSSRICFSGGGGGGGDGNRLHGPNRSFSSSPNLCAVFFSCVSVAQMHKINVQNIHSKICVARAGLCHDSRRLCPAYISIL